MYKYHTVVSGGTFDHFHKGHKAFLQGQLMLSEKVLIGITSDAFVKTHKKGYVESYDTRVANVKEYLLSQNALQRVEIAPIDDGFIPTVWQHYPIEAIVVTADTKTGADRINEKRQEQGLSHFNIHTIPEEIAKDGKVISSQRIRQGEIDKDGELFVDPQKIMDTLFLPEFLREEIAKPFGEVFPDIAAVIHTGKIDPHATIVVGDVVTESFQKIRFGQKVSIVDLFVKRERQYHALASHTIQGDERVLKVKNGAGSLTPQLFAAVKESIFEKGRYVILVDGEEDLAVLPCIVEAPLGFSIFYGQPDEGIVHIFVTEAKKKEAKKLLEKFTLSASK